MLPEEKVARRFSQIRRLKPPVNVEALVREFAILEEDFLPSDYDAVFLDKSAKHPRPRVIVKVGQPQTRRLFTLAHELGHIVIPWHNGTHFCRVDAEARLVDDIVRAVESQANRFAAKLLMPAAWVRDLFASANSLDDLVEAVKTAKVSYHAASIRLIQLLPKGFLFVEVNDANTVTRAGGSSETWVLLPSEGSKLIRSEIDSVAAETAIFKSGSSKIYWWKLHEKIQHPKSTSQESSAELLKRICIEVFDDDQAAKKAVMSVNGVIGAANGTNLLKGNNDLFTLLKHRFLGRPEIATLIEHKSFNEFLAKRVNELEQRRQKKA